MATMFTTKTTLTTQMEHVTPELAAQYLERNVQNRPISKAYVRQLSEELQQGRWVTTHQGIAFSYDGMLMDGQHRLAAIVHSGQSADLLVTRGLAPEAFASLDQHRRRTAGQILNMAGMSKDAPRVAAMARVILSEVHGKHSVSNGEATAYAFANQSVLEKYLPVCRRYGPAVGAAFAWASTLGWDEVESASSRLLEKLWDGPGDPMRSLDRRSDSFASLGQGQASLKAKFAIATHALLAVHEGRELYVARSVHPDYAKIARSSAGDQIEANRPQLELQASL